MCGGAGALEPPVKFDYSNLNIGTLKKELASETRKEKSRDAARNRRALESDYFMELDALVPVHGTPPNSQMSSIDKTSLIRLTVAYLKSRDFVDHGLPSQDVKDEMNGEMDVLEALNGFSIVLTSDQNVVHVSNNVASYVGLTAYELLGQHLDEFVHPCDHGALRELFPPLGTTEEKHVKAYVRMKCTITDRGRLINLKQASYKAMKIEGRLRRLPAREEGGLSGPVLVGLCTLVSSDLSLDSGSKVFKTRHSKDMKILESDTWLTTEGRYKGDKLFGLSFFDLVHAQDLDTVAKPLKNIEEFGHCETGAYRLLVGGGGYVWVISRGQTITPRKGSNKESTVLLSHSLITEVERPDEIIGLVQIEAAQEPATSPMPNCRPISKKRAQAKPSTLNVVSPFEIAPKEQSNLFEVQEPDFTVLPKPLSTFDVMPKATNVFESENMTEILKLLEKGAEELDQDEYNREMADLAALEETVYTTILPVVVNQYDELMNLSQESMKPALSPLDCSLSLNQKPVAEAPGRSSVIKLNAQMSPPPGHPTAITASLFSCPVTEKLFDPVDVKVLKNDPLDEDVSLQEVEGQIQIQNFFENCLVDSDLEKLSPSFIGSECIELKKGGDDSDCEDWDFQQLELDRLEELEFPDGIINFNANTEKLFGQELDCMKEEDDILRPSADIMWSGNQSDDSLSSVSFTSAEPLKPIHNLEISFQEPSPVVDLFSPPQPIAGPSGLCAGGRKENGLAVARLPVLNPSQLAPLALPSQLAPLALPSQLAPLALPDLLTPMDTGINLTGLEPPPRPLEKRSVILPIRTEANNLESGPSSVIVGRNQRYVGPYRSSINGGADTGNLMRGQMMGQAPYTTNQSVDSVRPNYAAPPATDQRESVLKNLLVGSGGCYIAERAVKYQPGLGLSFPPDKTVRGKSSSVKRNAADDCEKGSYASKRSRLECL